MANVKFHIHSSLIKTPKNKKGFRSYYTKINIVVKGEEEKGAQVKSVKVKFTQDADNNVIKEIKNGWLVVDDEQISVPTYYEVHDKVDEDGDVVLNDNGEPKKEYPTIWVRNIVDYTPIKHIVKQSVFVENEEETNPIVINEDGEVIDDNADNEQEVYE